MPFKKKRYTRSGKKKQSFKKRTIGGQKFIIKYARNVNKNIKTEEETKIKPIIELLPLPLSTLLMYDPNATVPSYIHYLVINIPNGILEKGDTVFTYNGPTPPPNTGTHYYIFKQYEQSVPIQINISNRSNFNETQFEINNTLNLKASNYFKVLS